MRILLGLLLVVFAAPAGAVEVHYEAYAAGLNVIAVDADFDVSADRYRVKLEYRTVGGLSLVMSSRQSTTVEGRFAGGRAVPQRFYSAGTLRGGPRVTQIDYRDGQPVVRQLMPATETEREPVLPAQQADTIDSLSAMAELIHTIQRTGRCDGKATTFDGRRLSVLEVRTSGPQTLEAQARSSFAGATLRCDFVGRQLAGFMLNEDRTVLQRPQIGTAWFAPLVPGGPVVPVRIAFKTRWFGDATMYAAVK